MIKAVCFDLDDTLYDYRGFVSKCEAHLCAITSELLGIPRRRCSTAYSSVKRDLYRSRPLDPAIFDWRERIGKFLSRLGRVQNDEIVDEIFDDFWAQFISIIDPYPDARPTIERIQKMGKLTAIISNGMRIQQMPKIRKLGLFDLLDAMFFSEDVGSNKPAPAIFRHALSHLDVEPTESLMVGDLCYVDIRGANDVGMFTCWLRIGAYSHMTPKNVREQPHFTISRLRELESVLQTL